MRDYRFPRVGPLLVPLTAVKRAYHTRVDPLKSPSGQLDVSRFSSKCPERTLDTSPCSRIRWRTSETVHLDYTSTVNTFSDSLRSTGWYSVSRSTGSRPASRIRRRRSLRRTFPLVAPPPPREIFSSPTLPSPSSPPKRHATC